MNIYNEISATKYWMLSPNYLRAFRMKYNNGKLELNDTEKKLASRISPVTGMEYDDDDTNEHIGVEQDKPFITLLYVDGPITRNGGACSYGSRELRDMMMEYADKEGCIGHVFYINTPGGSAWAINDFKQAIDYAHSKGQKVMAFVDGMCCSAGMYLAAICDERYYNNPKDEIGCIGVMAAFYTEADGNKNDLTGEVYHELYAKQSIWKNKEMREVANDNNTELIDQELNKLCDEFINDVSAACPKADKEEHLTGKVFPAVEVEGILVDGQKTLQGVFDRVIEISSYSPNNNQMTNNKYQTVASLMDVDELVVTNEGTHLDVSLLDTLQTNIEALQTEAAKVPELLQQLASAQQALEDANNTHANEVQGLNETVSTLQNDNEAQRAQIEQMNADLEGARSALANAEQIIAERDQTITDLNAQISDLQNAPGEEPDAGEAPANNGDGAEVAHQSANAPQWDPSKSAKENKEALDDYERKLKASIR